MAQSPDFWPPFTAIGRSMRLDASAVDGCACGRCTRCGKRFDQFDPEPLVGPAVEAVVDRCRMPILLRTIAPAATQLENMDNARDHPAIINQPRTAFIPWQKRFDHRPLVVR